MKEAARLPRISASAYYGYEFGFTSFSLNDNKRYYIGLNASIPIYHGKVISEKINEAEAEVEQISWQREYFKKNLASRLQEKVQYPQRESSRS
ncbi:MAG: TolC family protein [Candidatus Marinimicrobia bacterium]|nr:TolC family protein [Candidatus Neomarinimicrobiota bacterium]